MVSAPASDPAASPSEQRARDYLSLLAAQRFDEAATWANDVVRPKLPADKLGEVWSKIAGDEGAFVRFGTAREQERTKEGATVVAIECELERGTILVTVTLAADGGVAGLWFGPHQTNWHAPAYADRSAFSEREWRVGVAPKLSATLTLPKTAARVPVVVLVHGSGPNDRDESSGGSKLFRDLAWGLASRGVAVVRYDKRTYQYRGSLVGKAITYDEETVDDARAALRDVASLPEIDPARVFLVGHSLGASLAPRIASGVSGLKGLVLLAGSTRPFDRLLRDQTRYLLGLQDMRQRNIEDAIDALDAAFARARADGPLEEAIMVGHSSLPRSYVRDQLGYDAVRAALAIDLPMLVMQGERDYQVTADEDYEGWRRGLAARASVTFRLYPRLNHHFVAGEGKPTPAEYADPGHADVRVISDIAAWISALYTVK